METGKFLVLYRAGEKVAVGQHFEKREFGSIDKCAVDLMNQYFKNHGATILVKALSDSDKINILQSVVNQKGYRLYKVTFNPKTKINQTGEVDTLTP